jgi:hypothetical protein
METTEKEINLFDILQSFKKISDGLDKTRLAAILKEMVFIMPLPDSLVTAMPGYDEEENEMPITFFVTKPEETEKPKDYTFLEIMTELLLKTNFKDLTVIYDCLERMEKKGQNYQINGTEIEYSKNLGDYVFYLFISKE